MALSLSQDRVTAPNTHSSLKPQSILSRKRSNKEVSEGSSQSPKATKRLKVEFDSDVEVNYFDGEHGDKTAAVIQEEVRQTLRQREAGGSEQYDYIKSIFGMQPGAEGAPSNSLLQKYLFALASNTALLKRSCSDLVHAVLGTKWLARDESFVGLYTRFLGHLASSQGGYTGIIMKMLVRNFAHLSSSADQETKQQSTTRRQLQQRVHTALRYILQLIPAASGPLSTILTSSFPFPDDSKRAHVEYARNLLAVAEYAPELRSDILDLITERLIKIDVQVQIDVDELEEDMEDVLVQGHPLDSSQASIKKDEDSEDLDVWSDAESDYSDDDLDPEEERIKTLKSSVGKMDALLDILFEYYTPAFSKGSQTDMSSTFDQLLAQFRKTVLPTHRSRHTQFLLFHFAQSSPAFTTRFVDLCMETLKDKARASVLRRSAAAYLASFMARGAHVCPEDVWYAFNALAGYLDQLRREYEPSCRGPDPQRYNAYYATCQALIYIFCFRYRALLADPEDYDEEDEEALFDGRELVWASGVKDVFVQNLFSKLNPLKICAPEVVEEFEKIARHLQFLYIYHVIEANKRLRLSHYTNAPAATMARETSLTGLHGERRHQLEAYFPFDPYRLPLSKRWLVGDYNDWRGLPGLEIDSSRADQDSSVVADAEEDEDLVDDRTGTPSDGE